MGSQRQGRLISAGVNLYRLHGNSGFLKLIWQPGTGVESAIDRGHPQGHVFGQEMVFDEE